VASQRQAQFFDFQEEFWSGRRESNPRHSAWEADVLPLNYARAHLYSNLFPCTLATTCQLLHSRKTVAHLMNFFNEFAAYHPHFGAKSA
jgi:hypothetical protein